MAKKETTKKKTVKKTASKKIINEVADKIIENTTVEEKIEVNPEVMEELKKVSEAKVDLVEYQDPPMEVMNGDPTVVTEKEDKILEIQKEAFKSTFKENKKSSRLLDKSFGYSWNGMEIDY